MEKIKLHDGMLVQGNLDLTGRQDLTCLPDDITVTGYMSCSGCINLRKLPPNLTVGGSLSLRGCKRLASMEPVDVVGPIFVDPDLLDRTPDETLPLLIGLNFADSVGVKIRERLEKRLRGEDDNTVS